MTNTAVAGKLVAFAHAYERWRFSARTRARTEVTARVSGPTPWGPAAVAGKLVAVAHAYERWRAHSHTRLNEGALALAPLIPFRILTPLIPLRILTEMFGSELQVATPLAVLN